MEQRRYGLAVTVDLTVEEAESKVREALAGQGFGILTEIDVAATMKTKLGVEHAPYKILGACNPSLAHRALEAEPEIGVLLPCNVVVFEAEHGTTIEAMDPMVMSTMTNNPDLEAVAREARDKIGQAISSLV